MLGIKDKDNIIKTLSEQLHKAQVKYLINKDLPDKTAKENLILIKKNQDLEAENFAQKEVLKKLNKINKDVKKFSTKEVESVQQAFKNTDLKNKQLTSKLQSKEDEVSDLKDRLNILDPSLNNSNTHIRR